LFHFGCVGNADGTATVVALDAVIFGRYRSGAVPRILD
jgi:hypothetical protein